MLRVRKRRLQRWKCHRFKKQTSPSKSHYSSLRYHHPQVGSTVCLRFPLLEAMGRAEHVSALKHNSLETEISARPSASGLSFWAKGQVLHRAGGSTGLSALLPILLWNGGPDREVWPDSGATSLASGSSALILYPSISEKLFWKQQC